jgi:hypothetical protein
MSFTGRRFGVLKHSFRVGHNNTESIMAYQRYIINKEEIQNLLKDVFAEYFIDRYLI